ncbi:AMP-binding protein [Opitutus sp. ER46]|uniref:AMP-binding protein n=1 Tax=Opitutus sp. ER46 TaxID=2161864 RepID=UPI000D31C82A|nr:AMP-binding protein [Opitutus sp. ER46]PTX91210.1 long-chain fatty acid--CoA ligase [Opitutus sp. ER46]
MFVPTAATASPTATESAPGNPSRPWLAHYPPEIPPTTHELDRHRSLWDMLGASLERNASRIALQCLGHDTTYGELERQSRAFGSWLQAHRVQPGARVAVMLPNLPQYYVAVLGALRIGAVVVNVNPLYTARELEHQLADSGAEVIVLLENFAHTLCRAVEHTAVKHVIVSCVGDLLGPVRGPAATFVTRHLKHGVPAWSLPGHHWFSDVVRHGANRPLQPYTATQDDIAFLQYTGGTTGAAKGAMLSHRNLLAGVLNTAAWTTPVLSGLPAGERLTVLIPLPLYHIFALLIGLTWVHLGACAILVPNPRDIRGLIRTMRRHRFQLMIGVNTLFSALVRHPGFDQVDFSACRAAIAGGMATHRVTAERWQAVTGHALTEGYGLTETVSAVSCNLLGDGNYTGTIGIPFPSMEFVIRDEQGQDLPAGQAGELCVRGPQVMVGYWQRPDETAHVTSPDGFFHTGDIGVMEPNGYFRIVDRKKDMILVSGFNVYPNEIEDVVTSHPGVLDCAAVGIPDEHCGEIVKLFVVKRDQDLTAEELTQLCRRKLTAYKCPRQVEFVPSLPKSAVGKVLRRALRPSSPSSTPTS